MSFEVRRTESEPARGILAVSLILVLGVVGYAIASGQYAVLSVVGTVILFAYQPLGQLLWPSVGKVETLIDDAGVTQFGSWFFTPWRRVALDTFAWSDIKTVAVAAGWGQTVRLLAVSHNSPASWWRLFGKRMHSLSIPVERGDKTLDEIIEALDGRVELRLNP